MKRGDIYLTAEKGDYSGKPRPVVIIQNSLMLDFRDSVTICPLTSENIDSNLFRFELRPSAENGLVKTSFVMIDKINTVSKSRLSEKVGELTLDNLDAVTALIIFWLDVK